MRSNNDRKKTFDFTFFYTQTQTLHRRRCRIRKTEDHVHETDHDLYGKKNYKDLNGLSYKTKELIANQ